VLRPRFVSTLAVLVLAAAALLAGARQLAALSAYGDLATAHSLPRFVHGLHLSLPQAALGGARAQAAALLHGGDLAGAAQRIAALPDDDADARDLRGRLAQSRGDTPGAIAAYIDAHDGVRAQRLIDVLARRHAAAAVADEQRLVDTLGADPSATEITANAWWRLGQLRAQTGAGAAAERAYARALELAPNEETYLLAIGYQELADHAAAPALQAYEHAVEAVPNSADAFGGIATAAAATGDCPRARTALAQFFALRTRQPDPRNDVVVGRPLRRCEPM